MNGTPGRSHLVVPCQVHNVQLADIDRDGCSMSYRPRRTSRGCRDNSSVWVVWSAFGILRQRPGRLGRGNATTAHERAPGQFATRVARVWSSRYAAPRRANADPREYCTVASGTCPLDQNNRKATPCAISQCDALRTSAMGAAPVSLRPRPQPCTIDRQWPQRVMPRSTISCARHPAR